MFETLNIFDVTGIVSAGGRLDNQLTGPVITTPQGYKRWSMSVGGIAFLFTKLFEHKLDGCLFAFDNMPTYKLSIEPEYKGNRNHSSPERKSVYKQCDLAKLIFEDIGLTVLSEEGYEADDVAYSAWFKYADNFMQTNLITNDSDYYFMVNPHTTILPATSRGKTVTMQNYSEMTSKEIYTPYNTIVFRKMLFGEVGDNIEAKLPRATAHSIWDYILRNFPDHSLLSDYKTISKLIENTSDASLREKLEYEFKMIYPVLRPIPEFDVENFDDSKIYEWGRAVGNSKYGKKDISPRITRLLEEWLYNERF